MTLLSVSCLFCEDIREERSGQFSIIGTMPDNLYVQGPPPPAGAVKAGAFPILPRFSLYLRINFDVNGDHPKELTVKLFNPDGTIAASGGWEPEVIDQGFSDAKKYGLPFAGLVFKVVLSPFPIVGGGGKITAVMTIDGSEHLVGAMNITLRDTMVSHLPASQSPAAV